MELQIRQEQPADYRETEQVAREAFWNCYSPGCVEHYLLHVMRDSPNFIPELDFVAVADGKIIGSVAFMKSYILGDDGKRHDVLTLGPIADPLYYARVGFTAAEDFGIRTSENQYFAALHACPLYTEALAHAVGRYFEDEIYHVDEAAARAFDAQFPPKERLAGTPTQRRLEEVAAMLKDYT